MERAVEKAYINNVIYYQDILEKKSDALLKCLSRKQEEPEKIVKQEKLLNQWYINELNQKKK